MSLHGCRRRSLWLLLILSLNFVILGGRLCCLQVWRSKELAGQAVQQRYQAISLSDGRGDILDRHGRSLLDSRNHPGLLAFPDQYRGLEEEIIRSFSTIKGIELIAAPPRGALPFWIGAAPGAELSGPLPYPGLVAAVRRERYGPGALAAHVTGYLNESEGKGVSGIELAFEKTLSPDRPQTVGAVVDGRGRLIPGLGYRKRESGWAPKSVLLSLDRDLQREVERIMDRRIRSGAAVVLDPSNGDILALCSRPGFHPSALASLLQSQSDALVNRALCAYQPGSVFKTVIAAAALEEGLAGLDRLFHCPGSITVEGRLFGCSQLHPRQRLNLAEAFAYSCNSAFIELARELGPEKLTAYARRFGLGERSGLPLEEQAGFIPSAQALASPQAVANCALGQGEVALSPLQAALMMAVLANGGYRVQPRLVLSLTGGEGGAGVRYWSSRGERVLSRSTVSQLKYMLYGVIARGTAQEAATTLAAAGAKTGTAESGRRRRGSEVLNRWIAGFYPLEGARAVVVVFADDLRAGTVQQTFGEIIYCLEQGGY